VRVLVLLEFRFEFFDPFLLCSKLLAKPLIFGTKLYDFLSKGGLAVGLERRIFRFRRSISPKRHA
jgi:hypothetical protein